MAPYFYWLALALVLICLHSSHYFNSDEGAILSGAWHLLNGRELYIDFFEIIPPGSFYLVLWAWKILGVHYAVAKALGILSILLGVVAVFRIGRLFTSSRITYVPPVLYCLLSVFWVTINHNTFNAMLLAWATYFCAKNLITRSSSDAALGGLMTGLSILFLQHKGAAFFFVILFFFLFLYIRDRNKGTLKSIVSYFIFSMIPLLLLLRWPLPILFEELVRFPSTHYLAINRVSPLLFYVGSFYILLAFWAMRGGLNRPMQLLFTVQATLLFTTLQRADLFHTTVVLFPLLSMTPIVYEKIQHGPRLSRFMRYAYGGFFSIAAVTFIVVLAIAIVFIMSSFRDATKNSLLLTSVKDRCSSVYAGPFLPGMYYETGKLNPTKFTVLLTGYNTDQQFSSAYDELNAARPECVVVNYAMVGKFNYSKDNPVDKFIRDNYKLAYSSGDMQLYMLDRNPQSQQKTGVLSDQEGKPEFRGGS